MYDATSLGLEIFGHSGLWVYCKCPFHADNTPSAEFNVKTGIFYCFQCGDVYTIRQLANELGGSIEKLPDSFKLLSRKTSDDIEWRHLLNAPLALGNPYLKKRGVTEYQIKKYDVRSGNDKIIFISRNLVGLPVGVIIRRTDGKSPRYLKLGDVAPIWPADFLPKATESENIILVEGPFGVLNTRKFGFVSFALLKASPTRDAIMLLNGRKKITCFLDNDIPGYIGALKLMKLGIKAVIPGGEADELDKKSLTKLISKATHNHKFFVSVLKREGKFRILRQLGYIRR